MRPSQPEIPPPSRGPAVPFPPPLLFVAGLALGALLERWIPLPSPWPNTWWVASIGLLTVAVGFALVITGILTFARYRTAVYPNRPARLVVDSGIYARTRNPMYLGMTVAYLGSALLLDSLWVLLLLPLVLLVLVSQVIGREERYLRAHFPDEYAHYCERVPRWL